MIFVSTGLIKRKSIYSSIKYLHHGGIKNIEMSGGHYDSQIMDKIKKLKNEINFSIHNYFPPPKKPFTLNLATFNDETFKICKRHVMKTIRYCAEIGSKFYSFHGGFLIDPNPKELGKEISRQKINNEKIATELFLERVSFFSKIAKNEGIELLIENNVLTKNNLKVFKKNPLMMTSTKQTEKLVKFLPKNVNLLIDLAHLKISARTLNFSAPNFLKKFDRWIKAYHISDNKGLKDTNGNISNKSWFWPYLSKKKSFYTLELKTLNIKIINKQINLLKNFIKEK